MHIFTVPGGFFRTLRRRVRRGRTAQHLLTLLLLLPAAAALAQRSRGVDGNRTVASGTAIVNEYAKVTADAAAGATSITVASNTLNANSRFPSALTQGDLIMLIQMQGASINTTDAASYGTVTAYNNAGRYEILEVASVSGTTGINLTCRLKYSYSAAGQAQVVRLPRFSTLTINSGAILSGTAWDRTTGVGGVVAMEVANGTTLNGTINATGLGFRGGVLDNSSQDAGIIVTGYRGSASDFGAEKGEGIAGFQADYDALNGRYGRGAAANGGGGGNSHNAAGGGGANVGSTTWTGTGNPDRGASNAYDVAWNLEVPGFATSTSSGGGRGGYSYASTNQDALTVAPGNSSWGGNGRQNVGGLGGRPLENRGRLYLGGGGGAGDGNNGISTSGGNGGGLVYLLTGGAVGGSGAIQANGATGVRNGNIATSGGTDAAGGGGGGGSIVLHVSGTITGITASAQGGTGGSQRDAGTESEGPGGGGSGGIVLFTNSPGTSFTVQVVGGVSGTTSSTGMTEFPLNGATRGGDGLTGIILYNEQCAIADVGTTLEPLTDPTLAGQPGGFTATFTSSGPSGANEVLAQVQLPAGLTMISISNGGSYDFATGLVTYPGLSTLTSGQSLTSVIRFVTPPSGPVTASSTISTTTGQGNNTNPDAATASFNVTPVADVTTSIIGSGVLGQGQASGTFAVSFTNNGPSSASSVAQSVTLPAGSTGVSAPGAQLVVTNANSTVTITYPTATTLGSGLTNTFQFSFTAPPTTGPVSLVSNTGTSTNQGANAAADQFTFNANVTSAAAELQTTITPISTSIFSGQEGSFSIVFRNNGPDAAFNTVAQVQLPAGLVLTDNAGGSYDVSTGMLTFPNLTALGSGGTFSPVIKFNGSATGGTVTATASVTSGAFDSNANNNSATASIVIAPTADVVTTISGPATAAAGSAVTYVATVRNNGPSTAAGVTATVQLPKGLLSVTVPTNGAYDVNTGIVTLPAVSVANGGSQDFSITFTLPNNNQPVSGQARNTATTNDAVATNNNGSPTAANVTTTVTLPAGTCAGTTFSGQSATRGLYAEYYKGYFNDNFSFFSATPNLTRSIANVSYNNRNSWGDITTAINSGTAADPDNYSSRMRGYITITTGGSYTFTLYSDDAAWLWVGNNARDASLQAAKAVVDARGAHNASNYTGTITLAAGTYPVQLLYGESGGDNVLIFSYRGPDTGGATQVVPSSVLCSTQFSGPLPVELTRFTAEASNLDAQLDWTTAQEKNSAYFEVERSVAGQPFGPVGQVAAQGNSSQTKRYSFRDAGVARAASTVYYRLKQVDQDGTTAYSPVRTVLFEAKAPQFSVVPNPATDRLRVQYTDAAVQATATVYSVLGQPLLSQQLDPSGQAELDVHRLPAGSYVLRLVTSAGSVRNFHFVKQ